MKIDGMDWMDWLHKVREESELERKRLGLSGVEWLERIERRADEIQAEIAGRDAPVARDKPREQEADR